MAISSINNKLGFVFELGFSVGMLNHILPLADKNTLGQNIINCFEQESMSGIALIKSLKEIYDNSDSNIDEFVGNLEDIVANTFFVGFVQGKSLSAEYIDNIKSSVNRKLNKAHYNSYKNIKFNLIPNFTLEYHQASLFDIFGLNDKTDKLMYIKNNILQCYGINMSASDINFYNEKGAFLNADNIVVLKDATTVQTYKRETMHILIIDNKLKLKNVCNDEGIYGLYKNIIFMNNANGKKSNFSNISIDFEYEDSFKNIEAIVKYASTLRESSLLKLVQAGSYAYSFLEFLNTFDKLNDVNINLTIMGCMDNDFSIMNFPVFNVVDSPEKITKLRMFAKGYLSWERNDSVYKYNTEKIDEIYLNKIESVANEMLVNLEKNTNISKTEIDKLKAIDMGNSKYHNIVLTEKINNFIPTSNDLRRKHGKMIEESLKNNDVDIVILNGCPGIGKTTSVKNVLTGMDKYLFMYFSPRTALGDDLESKFKEDDEKSDNYGQFPVDFISLTAASTDEVTEDKKEVVKFNASVNPKESSIIKYIRRGAIDNYNINDKKNILQYDGENCATDKNNAKGGGYKRVCMAVNDLLCNDNYNKIITTLTLQACKKVKTAENTNEYTTEQLYRIFNFMHNNGGRTEYKVDDRKYKAFCKRMPNVFIMIDEITGAPEGKGFYNHLKTLILNPLNTYYSNGNKKLLNIKIIVADASLVNDIVVKKFLEESDVSQSPQIYVASGSDSVKGISKSKVSIQYEWGKEAFADVINANSYPAESLDIKYNILFASEKLSETELDEDYHKTIKATEDLNIIEGCLKSYNEDRQVILYIQDKDRLDNIKNGIGNRLKVQGESFEENRDFIVITSRLQAHERQKIIEFNNNQAKLSKELKTLKFIFMTSSASRGISFPDTTSLHCVTQTFGVESALMEIIQYVYRQRGHKEWDETKSKNIDFYFLNTIYYDNSDDYKLKKAKKLISLISYIILLRACVLTRINGKVTINDKELALVPLGGSGITGIDASLIRNVKNVTDEISKETKSSYYKELMKIRQLLLELFAGYDLDSKRAILDTNIKPEELYEKFVFMWKGGLYNLLTMKMFKSCYIHNGMMIFPLINDENKKSQKILDETVDVTKNELSNIELFNILSKAVYNTDILPKIRKPLGDIVKYIQESTARDIEYSDRIKIINNIENRFIAIPIQAYIYYNHIQHMVYPDGVKDRALWGKILEVAIRDYNPYAITPISMRDYAGVPYITFKSDDLCGRRKNMFNFKYVLKSTEINMIDILLLD